jgi:serine protease Do
LRTLASFLFHLFNALDNALAVWWHWKLFYIPGIAFADACTTVNKVEPRFAMPLMRPLLFCLAASLMTTAAWTQTVPNEDVYRASNEALAKRLAASIVTVRARIVDGAATSETLGDARAGTGILIGPNTVLTIGYLIMEADRVEVKGPNGKTTPATRIAVDPNTGFGVLRTLLPVGGSPLALGDSDALTTKAKVLTIGAGEEEAVEIAVLTRARFVGSWEYAVERAIFTTPPVENWSGAALVNAQGKLVGVGSLILRDAAATGTPGNMFVPVNLLKPVLDDLAERGRSGSTVRPWLGMSVDEVGGKLIVSRVTRDGPAHAAGVRRGDVVLGTSRRDASTLAEFFDDVWAHGAPGVPVKVKMQLDGGTQEVNITSADRRDYLRKQTVQ